LLSVTVQHPDDPRLLAVERGEQPSGPRRHITALDGLRGLAILMVFLLHTILPSLPATGYTLLKSIISVGHLGVDLFFVLSGFLITGILFQAKGHNRYFRNFYARRALRIFPLYYFFLILYYLVVVRFQIARFGADKMAIAARDLHWAWFYATNIEIARRGSFITASLNHFWTLSIEEHFYFVWPLLVYWSSRRVLLWTSAALATACLILRSILLIHGVSGEVLTSFTLCRVDSFAIGGAASLLLGIPLWRERLKKTVPVLVAIGIPVVIATLFSNLVFSTIGFTTVSLFFALLIIFSVLHDRSIAVRVLGSALLRFLGKYSYSLYVFHFPIQIAVQRILPIERLMQHTHSLAVSVFINMVIVASLSLAVALGTWNGFEKRFIRLKRFFPEPEVAGTGEKMELQVAK
jgi:peptidoglycan/LPS O-acetylase OafA/YrhL